MRSGKTMSPKKHRKVTAKQKAVRFVLKCPKCGAPSPIVFTKNDLKGLLKIIKTEGQVPKSQMPATLINKRMDN